jgi:predicted RNA binding protein YcfA (HicA-like mRNA interferase family)
MAFAPNVWSQLKNLTADDIVDALRKDGWELEPKTGATLAFVKGQYPRRRVVIHYHPRKTYGPALLKGLISDIGWLEEDLRRLRLIK